MIQLFIAIAQLLYGSHWQAGVSGDLGVAERTIRRWSAGADRIPPGVWNDLRNRLFNRRVEADRMYNRLSGLLSQEKTTLQPTPNTGPHADIEGVYFSMTRPDGKIITVLARREIFDDLGYGKADALKCFREQSQNFYRAASVKFDLVEFDDDFGIMLGASDFIPAFTSSPSVRT
ncbi:hypothetical protein [Bradyrhizobium sp. SZCCHNR1015]|uniref:hypothetical protein n=1 Tax=Bradyrhizobium sp. SZCCHNR1015 TaxID=3057338 RepID=UPI002915C7C1|nr:hypothetical protein [Bradyrhizobium sp. SZCCHNR1015]